jgi:hypothetical protein
MCKYLIIPDIHLHHLNAQRVIDTVPHDIVICLGDFFHDFNDTPEMNLETARWLKQKLAEPNFVALWGNHDLVSAFPSSETSCSGWTQEKQSEIDTVMAHQDWAKFKPCYHVEQGNWLISHAGISPNVFRTLSLDFIQRYCAEGIEYAKQGRFHPTIAAGWERGGSAMYGGITWQDFAILLPVAEFKQIVGHTSRWDVPQVRFLNKREEVRQQSYNRFNGWNTHPELAVNLDTKGRHYGILTDGVLSVHSTEQLLHEQE